MLIFVTLSISTWSLATPRCPHNQRHYAIKPLLPQ
jgi:hypothetical protein